MRSIDKKALKSLLQLDFTKNVKYDYLSCIPEDLFTEKGDVYTDMYAHQHLMRQGMFIAPYWKFLRSLARILDKKKVVEVFAGNGLITLALQSLGINIKGVDTLTYQYYPCIDMIKSDGKQFLQNTDEVFDVMLCIWPPYQSSAMKDVCDAYFSKNPQGCVIYCGEDVGGCTADTSFFQYYQLIYITEIDYSPQPFLYDAFYYVTSRNACHINGLVA